MRTQPDQNDALWEIAPDGTVSTFAGVPGVQGSVDGPAMAAKFSAPSGVAFDSKGNLFVTDSNNCTIRKISPEGVVSTFAGTTGVPGYADGQGTSAQFETPSGISIDGNDNLYVITANSGAIRKVTAAGVVTTLTLLPSPSLVGEFGIKPEGVAADASGNVYVVDSLNGEVWKISPAGGVSEAIGDANGLGSTDGIGAEARFNAPSGVAVDNGGYVYVGDCRNDTIRKIAPDGTVTTLAGTVGRPGSSDGPGSTASFVFPYGVAVDLSGNVYVSDNGNQTIRKITPGGGVTTLAGSPGQLTVGVPVILGGAAPVVGNGDGTGPAARFLNPTGVAVDSSGMVYVADDNIVRRITPAGVVTTIAGTQWVSGSADGPGSLAQFGMTQGVAVDPYGNLYVADSGNFSVRKITQLGLVTTLAGGTRGTADGLGAAAQFGELYGIAVDARGTVFVTDGLFNTIRKITPDGTVTTLAGDPSLAGGSDGLGSAALFYTPIGVAVDASENVFVADSFNNLIRVGAYDAPPTMPTEPYYAVVPSSQSVAPGSSVVFSVSSGTVPAPGYQWYLNGSPIEGANGATLLVAGASPRSSGQYLCVATNPQGTSSAYATLSVVDTPNPGRLINLSCRSPVGSGSGVLIAGFVVGGAGTSGSEPLLLRASGPALVPLGVTGVLPDTSLKLVSSASGNEIASNSGWAGSATVSSTANAVGAFAWSNSSSGDSALVETLPVGAYTALVAGTSGDAGVALAEVYDATPFDRYTAVAPRLINLSARTQVGQGSNVLIAGFVIGGTTSKTVLIRASGPALAPYGLTGVLPDPALQLFASNSRLIASNKGWGVGPLIGSGSSSVGAFLWGTLATSDSALLITLPPGAYTAEVTGASGDTGIALVEIYDVE